MLNGSMLQLYCIAIMSHCLDRRVTDIALYVADSPPRKTVGVGQMYIFLMYDYKVTEMLLHYPL